jgi:ADP-ribose pyrophosphatase YjhB (NUDIX family)
VAKTIQQTSAGGIVFRKLDDHIEVALIARTSPRRRIIWALPKGWVEPGETIPDAALREIREETGLTGRLVEPLGQIEYSFYSPEDSARIQKTVHFFLVEFLSGDTADHDHEVDEARWWPLDAALAQMTYQSERQLMEKARGRLLAPTPR